MSRVPEGLIEATASPDEERALGVVFVKAGLNVEVRAGYERKSAVAGHLPWIVFMTLPVLWVLRHVVREADEAAW